ncbi:glycosyltransferase [Granulicoccus phenolivorans]|uniref:glycosyltransferase n=1 Tax=Granulicoccus phenolivorans TaxID=266854 RepID=UPI0004027FEE|nr:glycosyltransferase [Granulicoccus phenolivorans]
MNSLRLGLLTSIGGTLDAFFPEIVHSWRREGIEVFPAAGTPADMGGATVIEALTRRPTPRGLRALGNLRSWATEHDLQVILTNTATASALVRLSPVGTPVIYFCHGLHWNGTGPNAWAPQLAESALLPRTAGVVCINSHDEQWFARHAPKIPRLRLLHGVGLDVEQFPRSPRPIRSGALDLVWIGEYTPRKNPHALLRVARRLRADGIGFRIHMLGSGELLEEIRAAGADLGQRLHIVGAAEPLEYLRNCDAVVHTAHWEGLPRVLLEAAAVGRPMVGFDVKGVRDIPGVTVVPEGDIAAMAAALAGVRDLHPALPQPDDLAYAHCADAIAEFAGAIADGSMAPGTAIQR